MMTRVHAVHGTPPLDAGLVRRDRLIRQLDERAPLTVVRAPGGSGKTVLAAQWAAEAGVAGVWMGVGQAVAAGRDGLWAAVAERFAAAGLAPPDTGSASFPSLVTDPLSPLRRHLGLLREPVVLVLDDFHLLGGDADAVADDLVSLLVACPQLTAVVLTRTPSALEGGLAAARVDRVVLSPSCLLMTLEETSAAAEAAGRQDDASALHRASGGNPLLLQNLLHGHTDAIEELIGAGGAARAAVAGLLHDTPGSRRDFMIRTAVPDRFDLDLARRLAGRAAAEPHLAELEAEGFLMRSDGAGGPLYRYPTTVRETLLAEAEGHLGPHLAELRRIAARWYEEHGDPKRAVRQAAAANDLPLVSEILLGHGVALMTQGVYASLAHLPPRAVARHPLIALVLAIGSYVRPDQRPRAAEYFVMAITAARVIGARAEPGERAALATVESVALRLTGRPAQGVAAARRAIRLLRAEAGSLSRLGDQVGILRVQNALTLLRGGRPDEARTALDDNFADLDALPATAAFSTVALDAALRVVEGDMVTAGELLSLLEGPEWSGALRDDYRGVPYHLAKAVQALERFDIEEARRHVEMPVPHLDALELRPLIVAVEALTDLAEGHLDAGLRRIQRIETTTGQRQLPTADRRVVGCVQALLHLAAGQAGQADQLLSSLPGTATVTVLRALQALLTGDLDRVVSLLARVQTSQTAPRTAAFAHLLAAASSVRAGRPELAEATLEKMAAIMVDCDLRFHLSLVPRRDLQALRDLAEERGLGLVSACLETADAPSLVPDTAPSVSLTERERAVLEALVDRSGHAAVAEALVVSPNTVKTQLRSLYRKLGVHDRAAALQVAYSHGLLDAPESGAWPEDVPRAAGDA